MERNLMITEARGNLLAADADALVNTVNTVGVMGKGIALQFKRAFPEMFKAYRHAADNQELALGKMHVWETQMATGPRFVINFPTKGHWKSRSKVDDIARGLDDLVEVIINRRIRSIAIPPLGCGHGGLNWRDVEPLIRGRLEVLNNVDVLLFVPEGAPAAIEMRTAGPRPKMSPGRAALIEAMSQYSVHALRDPGLIEVQKLMYFLQVAGEPLRLKFEPHVYGPYADNLRHVLLAVEGHYVSGFGDGSSAVRDAEPLVVLDGARERARAVLGEHPETFKRLERVLDLIDGFESDDSLELLATVHMVLDLEPQAVTDFGVTVRAVHSWNPRKARLFDASQIRVAWEALQQRGWTPALV